MSIEIITTADGSSTLRNIALGETYHSRHGAVQESVHVFIENGLMPFMGKHQLISILEVGFGTALNALLTWQRARQHRQKVKYTAIEPHPLPENIWSALNYGETLHSPHEYSSLHAAPWQIVTPLDLSFELIKDRVTLQEATLKYEDFDLVYYDAFAPSKQPELWELTVLTKVVAAMRPGGAFVTYCAKGQLKRDLRELQLQVETLPGPPGKKEMVRARKPDLSSL